MEQPMYLSHYQVKDITEFKIEDDKITIEGTELTRDTEIRYVLPTKGLMRVERIVGETETVVVARVLVNIGGKEDPWRIRSVEFYGPNNGEIEDVYTKIAAYLIMGGE